jgi:hypothetical protein
MIKIFPDNTTSREQPPRFLRGLKQESLIDLSWTDPELCVQDFAWWPEEKQYPEYDPNTQQLGAETITLDHDRKVAIVTYAVEAIPAEEMADKVTDLKAKKLAELTAYAKQYLSAAMSDYSEWEAISWPMLIQEAEQFTADGTVGEYMAAEIGVKYPTAVDLAAVLLQRKEVMKQLRAGVVLVRQQKEAQIEAATTIEDLNDINISTGWPGQE